MDTKMDTASDVITLLDILKGAIMNIGRRISRILMLLGNQPSVKGYQYIKKGIAYCMRDPRSVTNLSQLLYPKLAEEFGTTSAAVERAARSAIKESWHRRDRELSKEIFSNSLQGSDDVPSNSLYIAAVAEWLNDEE